MAASVADEEQHLSTEEQLQKVWSSVKEHSDKEFEQKGTVGLSWPGYDNLMKYIHSADYNDTLRCPMDLRYHSDQKHEKHLCVYGVAGCVKMELFPCPGGVEPYTGLLTPGTTLPHCLVRLSSAVKPPQSEFKSRIMRVLLYTVGPKIRKAKLFPCAALKIFREGVPSGNALFAGCKVGQPEDNYFAHCVCTQLTETMPRGIKPFVRKFWTYSDFPLSLGVSDLCTHAADGNKTHEPNFPFALILKPTVEQSFVREDVEGDPFDRFMDDMGAIPVGTHLFDVFACPTPSDVPDASRLQRIGRIVSTSEMVPSPPNDGLFFRHQRKEEDYEKRPAWKDQLQTKCKLEDRKMVGTVAKLAGWELFENNIAKGTYVDFER